MGRIIGTRQRAIVSGAIVVVLIVAIVVATMAGSHGHPAAAASDPATTTLAPPPVTDASTSTSSTSTSTTTKPDPTTTTTVRKHITKPVAVLPPVTVPTPPPVTPQHCLPGGDSADGTTPQLDQLPQSIQDLIHKMAKWAEQYPHPADAEKAGFARVTTDMNGMGSHYVNSSLLSDHFDPNKVAGLQYNSNGELVGFNYLVWSCGKPPEGFPGDADTWHQHSSICIGPNGEILAGSGALPMTDAYCKSLGGVRIVDLSALWMLHVWAIPGWESPNGVFSHDNPNVS
jgi:hypothetical protein